MVYITNTVALSNLESHFICLTKDKLNSRLFVADTMRVFASFKGVPVHSRLVIQVLYYRTKYMNINYTLKKDMYH